MTITHLAFLDESGDHSMQHIDEQFPVFALAATVFEKNYYLDVANPKIDRIKYKYWGHRNIIFHSVDIRKQKEAFNILRDSAKRNGFMEDINQLISELEFKLIAAGIHKIDHMEQYHTPVPPYDLTLEFIMERLFYYFKGTGHRCAMIAEARGQKENSELYKVYERLMRYGNKNISADKFRTHIAGLSFYPKAYNENGNQISDMVVYPVARKVLSRAMSYQPYMMAKAKMYCKYNGDIWGYGLKAFPIKTNARLRHEED